MDTAVIQSAWDAHREQLLGYAMSLTRDHDAAEDIVQESYTRLAREISNGRAPRHPRAWLYKVARNVHISDCRRQRTRANRVSVAPVEDWVDSAEEQVMRVEQRQELDLLLGALPPAERVPLVMAALGYRANEIAVVVGCAENAVRTRMCRLRKRLRTEELDIA